MDFEGQTLMHSLLNQRTHSQSLQISISPFEASCITLQKKKKRLVISFCLCSVYCLKTFLSVPKGPVRARPASDNALFKREESSLSDCVSAIKPNWRKCFFFQGHIFSFLLPILLKVKGWTARKPCLLKNVPPQGFVLGCWLDSSPEWKFLNAKKKIKSNKK